MSNIDYKAEVKKHYPTSNCKSELCIEGTYKYYWINWSTSLFATEHEAWQNAYLTLKKEGKIK